MIQMIINKIVKLLNILDLFTFLPLCAIIDNRYSIVHAGILLQSKTIGTFSFIHA